MAAYDRDVPELAIILAGGIGSRLGELTDIIPKPMVEVHGRPIIEHIVREIVSNGITRIRMAVGYRADKIMDYFGDGRGFGAEISYSVEKRPAGTGGALAAAMKDSNVMEGESAFVSNGDELFHLDIKDMHARHKSAGVPITLALKRIGNVEGFGVVNVKDGMVTSFVEKPDPKSMKEGLISIGKYIIDGSALQIMPKTESFSLERDFFHKVAGGGSISGYITDSEWYPTDNMERYERACKEWRQT